jgi:hypothetical protein
MKTFRALGVILGAIFVLSAVAATAAQAAEEPYYQVNGARLAAGETREITVKAAKSFVLKNTISKATVTCKENTVAKGSIILGSAKGSPGRSDEVVEFKECEVTNNGTGCKVEEPIVTKKLVNKLVYSKELAGIIDVLFTPETGKVFAELTFIGSGCKTPNTTVEGNVAAEALMKKTSLTFGTNGTEEPVGEVNFPSTSITEVFEDKTKVKVGLTAFGTAATLEGDSEIEVLKPAKTPLKWATFSV